MDFFYFFFYFEQFQTSFSNTQRNLDFHIFWLCNCLQVALNGCSEAHTICTASVCLLVSMIYFPLTAQSTDSPQWVTHSITFRVTQDYNSQALSHTHSSHALAGSHTVDSPSSAGVINDFLWLLSNRPSIVDPLSLICTQDMLLSYVRQPRVKFPVGG